MAFCFSFLEMVLLFTTWSRTFSNVIFIYN
jgi:hypothetical protein